MRAAPCLHLLQEIPPQLELCSAMGTEHAQQGMQSGHVAVAQSYKLYCGHMYMHS